MAKILDKWQGKGAASTDLLITAGIVLIAYFVLTEIAFFKALFNHSLNAWSTSRWAISLYVILGCIVLHGIAIGLIHNRTH